MGVKSTVELTRREAEERAASLLPSSPPELRGWSMLVFGHLSDRTMERVLEMVSDDANGGEGFENYRIVYGY